MDTIPRLFDPVCERTPDQIDEYVEFGRHEEMTPEEFVWSEEGTLDRATGQFLCTSCYIKAGQPSSPRGWRATTANLARDVFGVDL